MSEDVELRRLLKRIREAEARTKNGILKAVAGGFAVLLGIAFFWGRADWVGVVGQVGFTVGGMAIALWGIIDVRLYDRQHIFLLKKMERLPIKMICAECGKGIPEGNFRFCPYCGTYCDTEIES